MKISKVVIDYDARGWGKAKENELLKKYKKLINVGATKALPKGASDKKIGAYSYRYKCDILTADKTAYVDYFKNKKIKSVKITQFDLYKKGRRPIYLVMMDYGK